jgi:N-acetyl-gamma-glutamylphosphate reductase
MESKKTDEKKSSNTNNLSSFISTLGSNIGVSISTPKKKDKFNPYSAENQQHVQEIYDVINSYQKKTSERNIIVPKAVTLSKNGKKAQFEFGTELKAETFDEVVEEKSLKNISLDQSSKIVEITK